MYVYMCRERERALPGGAHRKSSQGTDPSAFEIPNNMEIHGASIIIRSMIIISSSSSSVIIVMSCCSSRHSCINKTNVTSSRLIAGIIDISIRTSKHSIVSIRIIVDVYYYYRLLEDRGGLIFSIRVVRDYPLRASFCYPPTRNSCYPPPTPHP